jgi:hypothetical protein
MKPLRVFIIQPFSAPHSSDFRRLVLEVCERFAGLFEGFTAVEKPSDAGPRLQDRIDSYIKAADICVADLTGTMNPNALLEVGAALTLNIPVILVSDRELPADIRGNLFINVNPNDLGKAEVQDRFRASLSTRLEEARHDVGRQHRDQFIAHGFESRRSVDFYSLVRRCERRVDLLTTNLGFVVNERQPAEYGTGKSMTLLQMMADSLTNKPSGFAIRMLVLHPESNYTSDRASGLGRDRGEFRSAMKADLEMVTSFVGSPECCRSVQIRTYDAFPLQMTYFFDDFVISSIVSTSLSSRNCVTYAHSLAVKGARETYERHFENLWGTAKLHATSSARQTHQNTWKPADREPWS